MFKDILDSIIYVSDERNVYENKKSKILEVCKVRIDIDSFKIIDVLLEMEGIYMRRCGSEFIFVYDFMCEIVVYYFGCWF